jgi:hypothetical protein
MGHLKDKIMLMTVLGPNPPALRADYEDLKRDGDEIGNSLLGKYLSEAAGR